MSSSFDTNAASEAVKEVASIFQYMIEQLKSLVCNDLFKVPRGGERYPIISNNEEFSDLIFYSLEQKCISEFQHESGFSASDCADKILDKTDNLYSYLNNTDAPDKQSDAWISLTKPLLDKCGEKYALPTELYNGTTALITKLYNVTAALTTESSNQESEDSNVLTDPWFVGGLLFLGLVGLGSCYYYKKDSEECSINNMPVITEAL